MIYLQKIAHTIRIPKPSTWPIIRKKNRDYGLAEGKPPILGFPLYRVHSVFFQIFGAVKTKSLFFEIRNF
jgi:hypothetical protein